MSRRRAVLPTALALLAAVLFAALGIWQVERLAWKRALIARVDARLAAAPVPLPHRSGWAALARTGEYARVRVVGTWLPGTPAFVQAVTDLGPGWWAIGAIRTVEGTVLVNRGFVAQDRRAAIAAPAGAARVEGLVRRDEPGGGFLRRNDPAMDRWYSRDIAAIARRHRWRDPAPFFVDADAVTDPAEPRGGLTVIRFPNNHLIYALTWFTLCGMALWFAWRIARRGIAA